MKHLNTIALSAVAAVLVAPIAAEAKTRHHAKGHAGPSTAAELKNAQAEISALQARLSSLEARIDQQGSSQQAVASQTATQAETATQLATTASAKADQAVVKADAASAAATSNKKGLDLVKWASNTQVNGRMFFNESNIHQKTAGANNANSGTGFNIKRMYLGVDHQFSPVYSATLLMDAANVVGQTNFQNFVPGTANLVGKGFFIKNAYLQAKLDPALIIRAGAAPTPWIPYVENQEGFRYIDNLTVDRLGYGSTADWGVHVLGDLAGGLISYQVSAVDGGGFRNVKVTKYVDLEGRVSAQYKGAWAAIGGYTGKRAAGVETLTGAAFPNTFRTAKRADVGAGYKTALFNIGGEAWYAKNWNNVAVNPINPVTLAPIAYSQDSARGYSVFGNLNFAPKWAVFGRYDWSQTNRITDPALKDHYFNVGLQWEPAKIVDIALVYKRETAKNGAVSTTDGVIGCALSATANSSASGPVANSCVGNGTYDEVGLFGQFKF